MMAAMNPNSLTDLLKNASANAAVQPPAQALMSAKPVDPHDTLTVPITGPVQMAASAPPNLGAPPMPNVSAAPRMSMLAPQEDHLTQRLMADYKKDADPYGSPDNHPGFFGKLLHGLAAVGNIAGDALVPRIMANVPGTQLHREVEEHSLQGDLQNLSKLDSAENLQGEQADEAGANAGKATEETNEMPSRLKVLQDAEGQREKAEQDKLTAAYRRLGLDPQGNPIPREQLSPQEQQMFDVRDSARRLSDARTALAQAQATDDPLKIKLAQEHLAQEQELAVQRLGIEREGLALREGQANGDIPTTQMRNMGEMAQTVLPMMDSVTKEVQQLADHLGPAVGRWNDYMVNKGGKDFPEFAGLDTDLDLLASAIVRTHFGARGGQEYRQELRKQFGEAQSPQDLINRIHHAEAWIQGYAQAGKRGGVNDHGGDGGSHQRPSGVPANARYITDPKTGKKGWAW